MRFYQACYGKPDNVNWTLFNVSPDLPQHMRTFFEKVGIRIAPEYFIYLYLSVYY